MTLLLSFFLFFLSSCSEKPQLIERKLSYIKTGIKKPVKKCQELGIVTGATLKEVGVGESYQMALKDIRTSAKGLGANYIYLKRISSDSKFIAGVAYSCEN